MTQETPMYNDVQWNDRGILKLILVYKYYKRIPKRIVVRLTIRGLEAQFWSWIELVLPLKTGTEWSTMSHFLSG